jgi:S-formylglutathione hydrolase FrmB
VASVEVLRPFAVLGCAGAFVLAGCGSGHGADSPTTPLTSTPATPTGSGTALSENYEQRCATSLARSTPLHTRGNGSLHELQLRSPDKSGTPRTIYVYRPGGIPDTAKLPVLYLLHGLPGSSADIWKGFDGKKLLDIEFEHGTSAFEVVTLDGHGAKHRDTEWADSSDGTDEVESFVMNVAIPAVEGSHRRDACHRAIAGFSMGGYGAMNLAQRHPDVFGQVASIAGYFRLDDPDAVFGNNRALQKANSPDQQIARMKGLRVFLLDAGQENLPLVKGETDRLAKLLVNAKIPVRLDYAPGVHNGDYAVAQEPEISAFLEAGWRPQP